jgi:hypothetical protein
VRLGEVVNVFEGEAIGWRVWHIGDATGRYLLAAVRDSGVISDLDPWWPPGAPWIAPCFHSDRSDAENHAVSGCSCGISAWADPEPAQADAELTEALAAADAVASPNDRLKRPRGAIGWGAVQLWGRVIECECGYRAHFARPLSINVVGPATQDRQIERAIEIAYGVVSAESLLPPPRIRSDVADAAERLAAETAQPSIDEADRTERSERRNHPRQFARNPYAPRSDEQRV